MIYENFFRHLAASTYLYDVNFIQPFNSLYKVGWRAEFTDNVPQFIAIYFIKQTTGWTVRDQIPVGTRFSPHPDRPWGPPSFL